MTLSSPLRFLLALTGLLYSLTLVGAAADPMRDLKEQGDRFITTVKTGVCSDKELQEGLTLLETLLTQRKGYKASAVAASPVESQRPEDVELLKEFTPFLGNNSAQLQKLGELMGTFPPLKEGEASNWIHQNRVEEAVSKKWVGGSIEDYKYMNPLTLEILIIAHKIKDPEIQNVSDVTGNRKEYTSPLWKEKTVKTHSPNLRSVKLSNGSSVISTASWAQLTENPSTTVGLTL